MRRSASSPARCARSSRAHGAQALGGIGSTHTTNEESYLFQKLLRSLGTNNVDHYHGVFPATAPNGAPWVWTDSLAGLEKASHIVLLGADPYHRQPILDLRIRKAIRKGARVYVVTPEPNRLDRLATSAIRYTAGQTGAVARALLGVTLAEGLTRGDYAASHAEELAQWRDGERLCRGCGQRRLASRSRRCGRWRARSQARRAR